MRFSSKGKEGKGEGKAEGAKGDDTRKEGRKELDWTTRAPKPEGRAGDKGGDGKDKKGFFKKDGERQGFAPKDKASPAAAKKVEVKAEADPDGWEEAKPSRRGKQPGAAAATLQEVKVGGGAFDGLAVE